MSENEEMLLKVIDCLRNINKSISMHIDNHDLEFVDKTIQDVCAGISDDLNELEKDLKHTVSKGEINSGQNG